MAFDYRDVLDMYDAQQETGATTKTLPEWSQQMNDLTGTDLYSAGFHDNWIKRASVGIDRLLEKSGAPDAGAALGRTVGGWVGQPDVGEETGRGLPRMGVNLAPMLIPGGGWAKAAQFGLTAALAGAETYTKTDSPAAGLTSGLTFAAMPGIARYGERAVLSRLLERGASPIVQKVGSFLGGQAGALGTMAAGHAATELETGQPVTNPLSPEGLTSLGISQLPFLALHLGGKATGLIKGPDTEKLLELAKQKADLSEAANEQQNTPDVAKDIPPVTPIDPDILKQTARVLAEVRGEQIRVKNDPNLTDEDKVNQINDLLQREANATQQREHVPDGVFGNSILPDDQRQEVLGRQVFVNKAGTWRAVHVTDDPSNPPELQNRVIGYSTKNEPPPGTGVQTQETGLTKFSLPHPQWWSANKPQEEWFSKRGVPQEPGFGTTREPIQVPTGSLLEGFPQQPEMSPEQLSAHLNELKSINAEVSVAETPADLQQAVVKLQGVQGENDLPATNDTSLRRSMQRLVDANVKPQDAAKRAVAAEVKTTKKQIEATRLPTQAEYGEVAERMGGEGFSIIDPSHVSKGDPTDIADAPLHDVSMEAVANAVRSPSVAKAFDGWKDKEDNNFGKDVADFVDLTDNFGSLKNVQEHADEAAALLSERKGLTWEPGDVLDFVNRPHVQEMARQHEAQIAKQQQANMAFGHTIVRPAGNRFLFSMSRYDPTTNKLGGKHTLPKSGLVDEGTFTKIGGVGKPLNKNEVALYKQLVPEAFNEGNVNVPLLDRELQNRGPVVETKELSNEDTPQILRERAEAQHRLDTAGISVEPEMGGEVIAMRNGEIFDEEDGATPQQLEDIRLVGQPIYDRMQGEREGARYGTIGPKDENHMPGYVEGLVRLPHIRPTNPPKTEESRRAKGILYSGPHFGQEDQNVLSFYRGYEETLPNGEKAFHVIEVQSDWAQKVREELASTKNVEKTLNEFKPGRWEFTNNEGRKVELGEFKSREEAEQYVNNRVKTEVATHPLLPVYESLALKAAIQHAKDIGATKVILSDAETAMMTEGHDRVVRQRDEMAMGGSLTVTPLMQQAFRDAGYRVEGESIYKGDEKLASGSIQNGQLVGSTPQLEQIALRISQQGQSENELISQAKGMRLHYDQTLPSAMEKLTGGKGEEVKLGQHKNVVSELDYQQSVQNQTPLQNVGSPVFKDASGNPKTQITGRSYDISHLPDEFTLTEPNRAQRPVPTRFNATEPEDIAAIDRLGINKGGQGMLAYLAAHPNPFFQNLAKDLSKFGETLNRISGEVANVAGGRSISAAGNRVKLQFSPGLLHADDYTQGYFIAHELVHGLSRAEMQNPTKVAIHDSLDDLRTRLIEHLPAKQRKAVNDAIASNWYSKYANGEVGPDSLMEGATQAQLDVMYGLLNRDELVSQGLSSNAMRDFMKSKSSEGQTWYHRFTNTIKSLLGIDKVSGTAFEEFLSHTDQLLDRGNHVADFRNFSDRYFDNLGMGEQQRNSNTSRATGLLLGMDKHTTPEELLDSLRQNAGSFRSPEWSLANRDVIKMFNQKDEDAQSAGSVMAERGYDPSQRGLMDMAHDYLLGEGDKTALDVLPKSAAKFVFETARDAKDILGVLHAATTERNRGAINLADPKSVEGPVKNALDRVNEVLDSESEHRRQISAIQGLFRVAPDGFFDGQMDDPSMAPWALRETKDELGRIWKVLAPVGQIVRRLPKMAEVFSKGWQLPANINKMASESLKVFGTDLTTMKLDKNTVRDSAKVFEKKKLETAVNKWIELTQKEGEKNGKIEKIPIDHPKVEEILRGLNSEERDQVDTKMQQRLISNQHMQEQILEKGLEIASTEGGSLVSRMSGGKLEAGVKQAGDLLRAFTADRTDPAESAKADAQMNMVQQALKDQPEAFLELAKFAQEAAEAWQKQRAWFQENPDWASAQRYGKFIVEFKQGGKMKQVGVDSKTEAESLAKGAPFTIRPNRQEEADRPPVLGPDSVGVINFLREKRQNQIDILQKQGLLTSEEAVDALKQYAPEEALATAETYRRGVPNLTPQPRRLSKLSDEHPWLQNHFSYIRKTANYWSRQLLRAQVRAHLLDPELAQNKELSALVRDHYDNLLKPDTELGKFAQKMASTWFMGYNIATAMVNATQPFLTHVAELTSMTGKPIKSYKQVLSALALAGKAGKFGEWGKEGSDLEWLRHKATQSGERELAMYDDQAAAQEAISTNYLRVMKRGRVQSVGQKLGTMAGNFSTTGLWLFRQIERLNNDAALIASFKHFRESEPNLSRDEAFAKASEFNHAVNYGGGPAQRSIGLYKAVPRTPAMLATAMQSYVLGSTFQLARYIRAGLFRPEGLTPHEVFSARKAAVQMLSTQFALAGTLGLPFVSSAIAVLDKTFPDLEVNKHLREWMHQIAGEDGENGGVLTDMAMTGIPSMLGWDMQSRLSMGNTVPGVSEVNGFQPELLLGAPANMVSNFVGGATKLASGNVGGANAFVPPALKKILQLVESGGQALDYKNRPIFTPTTGEIAGMALGFQPKRLSDFNAASRIAQQSQDNITRHEGQFHAEQAAEVLKGNFGTVRANLQQRVRDNKTYDPVNGVRSIARAAEELTFPRDLRNEGTLRAGDTRAKLLQTFSLPPTQASETNRLQFRTQVAQRLGLMAQSSTDLRQAQLMDELRRQNPEASRSELRRQVALLSRGRHSQILTSPTE